MDSIEVICYCGGVECEHAIGSAGCHREIIKVPPRQVSGTDRWLIDGESITGKTLREQRLYSRHSKWVWSKPKIDTSDNSLPDET